MTTDNTQAELDELKRLYRCIMHDFHDGKDREDMWVREVGLVVNKQVEEVLDRLVKQSVKYGGNNVMNIGPPNIAVPVSVIEVERSKLNDILEDGLSPRGRMEKFERNKLKEG